ncbi:formate/nitrite transporter family protein [Paenibacillus alvei]
MEQEPIKKAVAYALKKKELIDCSFLRYFTKAILAGMYIGFALVICYKLAQPFYDVHSPGTYMMTAMFFGLALVLIMYGGGELFTGNTMAFTMSTIAGRTTWSDTFYNWVTVYLGNFAGAVLFAVLILLFRVVSFGGKNNLADGGRKQQNERNNIRAVYTGYTV